MQHLPRHLQQVQWALRKKDANDLKLKYEIKERRAGDIIEAYANNSLAEKELGWKPETKLSESMRTAWEWQKSLENKR